MKSNSNTIEKVGEINCTGCGCCISMCPVQAISFQYNNEGFFFPEIDNSKCIHCSKCYTRCPVITPVKKNKEGHISVIQHKDEKRILNSASGGGFYGIAEYVMSQGGLICGCVLNEKMLPTHILTDSIQDLVRMQGSKYVQSLISSEVYQAIFVALKEGRKVLFSGTPCQIAGLKSYLNDDFENLYTIGLICHGVAGPGLYLNYIHKIQNKIGGSLKDVQFRSRTVGNYPKNHSMRIITENGEYNKQAFNELYGTNFYHNRILRESCYSCQYASKERVEDITLGDYNEAVKKRIAFPSKNGFNIVICNTSKGTQLLKKAIDAFYWTDIDQGYEQINLIQPTLRPAARDLLKKATIDFDNPESDANYIYSVTLMDKIKSIIPAKIKNDIKKMIGRKKR